MRNKYPILAVLLVVGLILAACSSSGSQSSNNSGNNGQAVVSTATSAGIPNTGATSQATAVATGTQAATTQTTGTAAAVTPSAAAMATSTATSTTGISGSAGTAATATAPATSAQATATVSTNQSSGAQGTGPTSGLIGIANTEKTGLASLSALFDFRVVDTSGNEIGKVRDFVVNMCEAHILHIVVDPAASLGVTSGQQVLIPYEALLETPNNGKVDVAQNAFVIKTDAASLKGVPSADLNTVDLQSGDWDVNVMTYWKSHFRLALTTGCSVPAPAGTNGTAGSAATVAPNTTGTPAASGTVQPNTTQTPGSAAAQPAGNATPTASSSGPSVSATRNPNRQIIYRVALASKVLSANLQDGNGVLLGVVKDIAIVVKTGRVQFIVVQASASNSSSAHMVALPPGAVNVLYANGSNQPALVLLVATNVYQTAPVFNATTSTTDQNWFNYWNKYVPMTMNELP